jgi:hypothetical protein
MKKEQLANLKIKNIVKSFLDEGLTPLEIRIQVAKGLIPLETKELVTAFYFSLFDSAVEVKAAAKESLDTLPDRMILTSLTLNIPPHVLNYFAKTKRDNEQCLEAIILNRHTATNTIKDLAGTVSEKLAMMIADNQERIIKDPEIVERLEGNPNVHVSLIERLKSFLNLFASTEEEAETAPAQEMLPVEERPVEPSKPVSMEVEFIEEAEEEEPEPEDYTQGITKSPSEDEMQMYSSEEIEELKQSTYQRIQSMSIAEKIQEALKGSREARAILIKDANKLVSSAVIKSPKITEDEIVKITASRSISDEVLRLICMKDEWLRNYQVKLNLVNNPKTPFHTVMKYMNFLHKRDLIAVSKSKMVPTQVALTAKKMVAKKR